MISHRNAIAVLMAANTVLAMASCANDDPAGSRGGGGGEDGAAGSTSGAGGGDAGHEPACDDAASPLARDQVQQCGAYIACTVPESVCADNRWLAYYDDSTCISGRCHFVA